MFRPVLFTALVVAGSAAQAGEKPLYAPAPDWIRPAPPIDRAKITDASPIYLTLDTQQRLKDGEVTSYADTAARIASPQVLDAMGTVKLPWQPDKGDLIIHKAEIIRGTERIDLLKGGERFSVLRREEQLDQRMLNGVLTVRRTRNTGSYLEALRRRQPGLGPGSTARQARRLILERGARGMVDPGTSPG